LQLSNSPIATSQPHSSHVSGIFLHISAMPKVSAEVSPESLSLSCTNWPTSISFLYINETTPSSDEQARRRRRESNPGNQFCRYFSTSPSIPPINKFGIYALFSFLFLN